MGSPPTVHAFSTLLFLDTPFSSPSFYSSIYLPWGIGDISRHTNPGFDGPIPRAVQHFQVATPPPENEAETAPLPPPNCSPPISGSLIDIDFAPVAGSPFIFGPTEPNPSAYNPRVVPDETGSSVPGSSADNPHVVPEGTGNSTPAPSSYNPRVVPDETGKRTDAERLAREKDKRHKAEKKARQEEERAEHANRLLEEKQREDTAAAAYQFSQAYHDKALENQHLLMKIQALENDARRQHAENEDAVAHYQRELDRTKKTVDQCEARIANMLSANELDQRKIEEERGRYLALSEQSANLERSQTSLREQLRSTEEQNRALRTAADRADCDSRVAQTDRIGELTAENGSLRAEASALQDSLAYAKNQAAEKDLKLSELARKLETARAAGPGSGPCPLCPELKEKVAKLEEDYVCNTPRRLRDV